MIEASNSHPNSDHVRHPLDPDLTQVNDLISTVIHESVAKPKKPDYKAGFAPYPDRRYNEALQSYTLARLDGRHSPGAVAVRAYIRDTFPDKPLPK